jgi:hypothetical protein
VAECAACCFCALYGGALLLMCCRSSGFCVICTDVCLLLYVFFLALRHTVGSRRCLLFSHALSWLPFADVLPFKYFHVMCHIDVCLLLRSAFLQVGSRRCLLPFQAPSLLLR